METTLSATLASVCAIFTKGFTGTGNATGCFLSRSRTALATFLMILVIAVPAGAGIVWRQPGSPQGVK